MKIPLAIAPALQPNVNVSRGASFAVEGATLLGAPVESVSKLNFLLYKSHVYIYSQHLIQRKSIISVYY